MILAQNRVCTRLVRYFFSNASLLPLDLTLFVSILYRNDWIFEGFFYLGEVSFC